MGNRIRMYFAVFGEWPTPGPITSVVGREPTRFEPKGEKIGKSSILRKQSAWVIDSDLAEEATIEAHLASLLNILEQHEAGMRSVAKVSQIGIQCAAYWQTSQPGFHLSHELLSRVAAL